MLKSRLPQIAAALPARVKVGLEAGADGIASAAKDRVTVASGKLRESIHTDIQPEGVYVVAGDNDAWYGHLVEYGTSHTAARPFLIPALEERTEQVRLSVATALKGL